jgi:hypothetical protein
MTKIRLRKCFKNLALMVCLANIQVGLGWSITGHEVIAYMAYQDLDRATKQQVDYLTSLMFASRSPEYRFLLAAAWPDMIKRQDISAFNQWHFISLPYAIDNTPTKPVPLQNVVWAVGQSVQVLSSDKSRPMEKAWFLNFLTHFVGDIHQPLHSATLFSEQFPDGDRGGNLYRIQSPLARNLHAFWDKGAGLFVNEDHSYFRLNEIKTLASDIMQQYPQSYFGEKIKDLDPNVWARESYELAKNSVYQIGYNSVPTDQYVQTAQGVVKQQTALAAYRLAFLLNSIFSGKKTFKPIQSQDFTALQYIYSIYQQGLS